MVKEEVNPIDFIAITSFQVFLPELYYAIRDNKDLFTGVSSGFGGRSEKRINQERKQCNEILNLVPENIKENIKELLIRLFPKLKSIWGNTNYGSDWLETWRKNCRICSPDVFDTYFRLAIPKGEISQREIQTILSFGNDPNSFAEALLRLNEDGKIIRFLERLEDYTRDYIPEEKAVRLINFIKKFLPAGGYFLTGNIKWNREKIILDWVFLWPMIYRNERQLGGILARSGFPPDKINIFYEPFQIHAVSVCMA